MEGVREVSHCLAAGFAVETLFYCPDLMADDNEAYGLLDGIMCSVALKSLLRFIQKWLIVEEQRGLWLK